MQVHHCRHYKKQRNLSPMKHPHVQEYAVGVHHAGVASKLVWAGTHAAWSTAKGAGLLLQDLLCTAVVSTPVVIANCSTTTSIASTIVCGTNDPPSTTTVASSQQWQRSTVNRHRWHMEIADQRTKIASLVFGNFYPVFRSFLIDRGYFSNLGYRRCYSVKTLRMFKRTNLVPIIRLFYFVIIYTRGSQFIYLYIYGMYP